MGARVFLDTPALHATMVLVVGRASYGGGVPVGEAREYGVARRCTRNGRRAERGARAD